MKPHTNERRISPSMIVAIVAVVLALGGTAIAGTVINGSSIRNKSITGSKLANGTVVGLNVRNFTLKGTKIVNNGITGRQVNEATLVGTPPGTLVTRKLALNEQVTVFVNGPLSLSAKCRNDGANDIVDVYAATTAAGSVMDGANDYNGGVGLTLEPGTVETTRRLLSNQAATGITNVDNDADDGWVLAPDGSRISVTGDTATLGVNYLGAKCFVAFYAVADKIA